MRQHVRDTRPPPVMIQRCLQRRSHRCQAQTLSVGPPAFALQARRPRLSARPNGRESTHQRPQHQYHGCICRHDDQSSASTQSRPTKRRPPAPRMQAYGAAHGVLSPAEQKPSGFEAQTARTPAKRTSEKPARARVRRRIGVLAMFSTHGVHFM